ncbi:MAG: tRNA pseudouridine(38-40) synthase TruA [Gammaproteobacteria bacterium]|jgi:tRNA pseudouridine38-40 synthase
MRIALRLEYDGRNFAGWERQIEARTVQAELEQALSQVAAHGIRTTCAGRTDAGVHAHGQVVHFDSTSVRTVRSWIFGANSNLPRDVSVTWAGPVERTFHARFSARSRHYQYIILNRFVRSALLRGRVTWECRRLEESVMQAAAGYLLGEHDFSAYRSLACQAKNPVRTIYRLDVRRYGEVVLIDVVANGFLHHMVRNIAGVLMAVGMGKHEPRWAYEVMASRDRTRGGITAPPDGLCLLGVDYPPHFGIPRVSPPGGLW